LPSGPLLSWKRGDAAGVAQRLWVAALVALGVGLAVYALASPRQALGAAGLALGAWLVAGTIAELVERARAFRVPAHESWRRLRSLPRGAWGMTLAHLGLGVFVLGACCETGWKAEAAQTLPLGGALDVGGYHRVLDAVGPVEGKNYDAERGTIQVTRAGAPVCTARPERRVYEAGGQTTSEVAICYRGLSHLYIVLGERRAAAGQPVWLVRAYWNPLASLLFLGPVIMALGGLVSLSDRRLRLGLAVVDGLVLADQAADVLEDRPRTRLLRRVGQALGRVGGRGDADHAGQGGRERAQLHAGFSRRCATPRRRRRSDSETTPPSAMITGPRKISVAQGFQ
jgi:cytochrome c-type biogenesis protein CcmF